MGDAAKPGGAAVPTPSGSSTSPAVPFVADSPSTYVAKVKNILVGLPPTDAEVAAVTADPTALQGLIDGWMATPAYQAKMLVFFELAFQQTQITNADFADQVFPDPGADPNGQTSPELVQNAKESFARTILASNQKLTNAMTTTQFMMTPALMELYAYLDTWQVDDFGKVTDRFAQAYAAPGNTPPPIVAQTAPLADPAASYRPGDPNFLHFTDPDVANSANQGPNCYADPIVFATNASALHYILNGSLRPRKNAVGGTCGGDGGSLKTTQFLPTDYTTWKLVTVRAPQGAETPTQFWDLPSLRQANELVLQVPRIGFFSTPAFFANWQTNTSNQMRVTVNQALIVATGAQIDGSDSTVPSTTPGLDPVHAAPGTACFGCHQLLDPTRSILASTYSWNYHDQTEKPYATQPGLFAFQGVIKPMNGIADFGTTLATHPLFASAWVQKLCYYANSGSCETNDPEFQRIVGVFQSSGYQWNALVRELLSSPLVTHAATTQTATDLGEIVAVSRRDHLCASYDNRLGFSDVCGLDALSAKMAQTTIPEIVSGLPSDGYGRGATAPVLPNQPTLFFRAGTENICEAIAAQVIDAPAQTGVKQWSSMQSTAAIGDFVHIVMGLAPSDARASQAQSILQAHYTAAVASGASASDSLKSTFVAACLSPSAVSIGL